MLMYRLNAFYHIFIRISASNRIMHICKSIKADFYYIVNSATIEED